MDDMVRTINFGGIAKKGRPSANRRPLTISTRVKHLSVTRLTTSITTTTIAVFKAMPCTEYLPKATQTGDKG